MLRARRHARACVSLATRVSPKAHENYFSNSVIQ